MTRAEVVKKVEKLRRLAARAKTPTELEEANTARQIADKLAKEHGLTDDELKTGAKVQAFDEMCDRLSDYVSKHQVPKAVVDVVKGLKTSASDDEKKNALSKVVTVIRVASLFSSDRTVSEAKKIVNEVLTMYEVQI